ncbi:MAG: 2-phospho-L-lactate guanylyltransferase [Caldilineae bacterium]|nr:MAG: 2-phospho-L-lactate guanylyltransferase [Caldilineae bacterium]
MSGALAVIIPMKSLSLAKRRLHPALSRAARRALALEMLEHVLATVSASGVADLCVLISADTEILHLAPRHGFEGVRETQSGYNQVVRQGLNWAAERGAAAALVLPADLPYLTAKELQELTALARTAHPAVVLAPDAREAGTNALLLRPPLLMRPSFGPNSFARHCHLTRQLGIEPIIYRAPGLAHDVDWPADLLTLPAAT